MKREKRYGARRRVRAIGVFITAAIGFLWCGSGQAAAQSLTWLVQPGWTFSGAQGVSADGSTVVGYFSSPTGWRAVRWYNGTMETLSMPEGHEGARAFDVSADGAMVVGYTWLPQFQSRAARWGSALDSLGVQSIARAVSDDGSVTVGAYYTGQYWRAFRWEGANFAELNLGDAQVSDAFGVSRDGAVIVGSITNTDGQTIATRWQHDTPLLLGILPDSYHSTATGVSSDGATVVGYVYDDDVDSPRERAFRWTAGTEMVLIPNPFGDTSAPYGVTARGRVIVGWAWVAAQTRRTAFRWTETTGMQDLNQLYGDLLATGSYLQSAYDISPNGRYIVGDGYNATTGRFEAYLLDTGPQCAPNTGDVDDSGVVDDADLLAVLFVFGSTGDDLGRADVNCDNQIDDADLLIVLFNFGSCPGC